MAAPLYLLDTNILVHGVRMDDTGQRIKATYDLLMTQNRPLISVVSDGELRSLAEQWAWVWRRSNRRCSF